VYVGLLERGLRRLELTGIEELLPTRVGLACARALLGGRCCGLRVDA
jgi:hypothetical protein